MRVLPLTLACLLALPAAALAAGKQKAQPPTTGPEAYLSQEQGPPSGEVAADGGKAVILPEPPRPGEKVKVPEGWWQVESAPSDDHRPPGVLVALSPTPASRQARQAPAPAERAPAASPPAGAPPPPEAAPPPEANLAEACRDEREAYAKRLLRMAGITEVEHPLNLFEGLDLGFSGDEALSPYIRQNLFGLPGGGSWEPSVAGVPVVRNLAFDFELQRDANRLSRCVADNRGPD